MTKITKKVRGAWKGLSRKGADCLLSKKAVAAVCLTAYNAAAFAQKGVGGFTSATTEIQSYADPVQKLLYAIAAVISLVGAFNIYFKMQNGDQDVKKTIMMTIGGCVAFIAAATALPAFFK